MTVVRSQPWGSETFCPNTKGENATDNTVNGMSSGVGNNRKSIGNGRKVTMATNRQELS